MTIMTIICLKCAKSAPAEKAVDLKIGYICARCFREHSKGGKK